MERSGCYCKTALAGVERAGVRGICSQHVLGSGPFPCPEFRICYKIYKRGSATTFCPLSYVAIVKPQEKKSEKDKEVLKVLLSNHPQAAKSYPLAQKFIGMVKDKQGQLLDE